MQSNLAGNFYEGEEGAGSGLGEGAAIGMARNGHNIIALDDSKNFTKRDVLRKTFDDLLATPEGHLDPKEMIDRMIESCLRKPASFEMSYRSLWKTC